MIQNFKFVQANERPVFDISPHHARMASCYRDLSGIYHLFIDYIDASLKTIHSWQADIRYYRSSDLKNWEFVETAVSRGRYDEALEKRDCDCYGVGSPHVLYTSGKVYLFYAGRGNLAPDLKWNAFAEPGKEGYVSGTIMLAIANTDINGAPSGSFSKHGPVIKRTEAWESMRIDDPCALVEDNVIHLYHKGFRHIRNAMDTVQVGYAKAELDKLEFKKHTTPIFSVAGGGEMPRVFKYDVIWNMFYRHFDTTDGSFWRHYVSIDGLDWKLHDPFLFDCAGSKPGTGATDMMLINGLDGEFIGKALACGMEDGVLKLWFYNIDIDYDNSRSNV